MKIKKKQENVGRFMDLSLKRFHYLKCQVGLVRHCSVFLYRGDIGLLKLMDVLVLYSIQWIEVFPNKGQCYYGESLVCIRVSEYAVTVLSLFTSS